MPLRITDNKTEDYFVPGFDDAGEVGIPLLPGQVLSVTSADTATVVITPDAVARPALGVSALPGGVPDGTVMQGSGKVAAAKPAAQPNVAINVTVHIANADGTPVLDDTGVPVADLVDTVTVVPGLLKSEGILFGNPA